MPWELHRFSCAYEQRFILAEHLTDRSSLIRRIADDPKSRRGSPDKLDYAKLYRRKVLCSRPDGVVSAAMGDDVRFPLPDSLRPTLASFTSVWLLVGANIFLPSLFCQPCICPSVRSLPAPCSASYTACTGSLPRPSAAGPSLGHTAVRLKV